MKHAEGYWRNRKKWQPDYHLKVENVNAFFDINGFFLTKLYGQQQHPFLFFSVHGAGSQLIKIMKPLCMNMLTVSTSV